MPAVADQRRVHGATSSGPDAPIVASVESLPEPRLMAVPALRSDAVPLRRHAEDPLGGSEVSGDIAGALRRRSGQGGSLPDTLSSPMSNHLGMDLSGVRVHTDPEAGKIAHSLQATAFTHGNDIYFAPGAYRPGSSDGQRVLAHEVSHIAAQRSGADRGGSGGLTVGMANDPAEAAADASADRMMAALRRSTAPASLSPGIHADTHDAAIPGAAGQAIRRLRWPWEKSKGKGSKAPTTATLPEVTAPVTITQDVTSDTSGPSTGTTQVKAPEVEYPRTATIGTEQVLVNSKDEEDEANRIATELKDVYGLDLSSEKTIQGIKNEYPDVPKSVTDQLAPSTWTIRELRAMEEAASYYAPILGSKRDESTLSSSVQGVTSIGKLKNAIDEDEVTGELDDSTLGEQFTSTKNVGLFETGTNDTDKNFIRPGKKKTDVQTSLTATSIHEMAHALVEPLELASWVRALNFWKDRNTKSGKWRTEKPPTSYGRESAAEDLCESVAMYFINAATLKKKCPLRFAFVDRVVKGWKPAQKSTVVTTVVSSPESESRTPSSDPK